MNLVERYSRIKTDVITLRSRKEAAARALNTTQEEYALANQQLTEALDDKVVLESCLTVMKQLIDVMSSEQINQLKELLSYGLRTIFADRDYSVDIVISESRNVKQANFMLVEKLANGDIIKSEFDSIGGGVLAVVGLIIQIYYIIYNKNTPVIFMDEALSQVSTQYLGNVMRFLDELATTKHFKFVLITHDDRMSEYGQHQYNVVNGVVTKMR